MMKRLNHSIWAGCVLIKSYQVVRNTLLLARFVQLTYEVAQGFQGGGHLRGVATLLD